MVWLREIAGWVLLGVGLAAFAVCYLVFLLDRRGVSAAVLGGIGFVVFRGGLHLLKVAMAARAVQGANAPPAAAKRPVGARAATVTAALVAGPPAATDTSVDCTLWPGSGRSGTRCTTSTVHRPANSTLTSRPPA